MRYPSVDKMLDEITGDQLMEWIAFNELEPFGDEWRQTGRILALLHNVNCRKIDQKGEEFFMPLPVRKPTGDELAAKFRRALAATGKEIVKNGSR